MGRRPVDAVGDVPRHFDDAVEHSRRPRHPRQGHPCDLTLPRWQLRHEGQLVAAHRARREAARILERPVKLVITRDQMATMVGFREEQRQHITIATDDSGVLTGLRHIKTSATSPFDDFAEPTCNAAQMMYACPNVQTDYRLADQRHDTGVHARRRADQRWLRHRMRDG